MLCGTKILPLRTGGAVSFDALPVEARPEIEFDISSYAEGLIDAKHCRLLLESSNASANQPTLTVQNASILTIGENITDLDLTVSGTTKSLIITDGTRDYNSIIADNVGLTFCELPKFEGYVNAILIYNNPTLGNNISFPSGFNLGSSDGFVGLEFRNCGITEDIFPVFGACFDSWDIDLRNNAKSAAAVNSFLQKVLDAVEVFTDPDGNNGTLNIAQINVSGGTNAVPDSEIVDALVLLGVTVTANTEE